MYDEIKRLKALVRVSGPNESISHLAIEQEAKILSPAKFRKLVP